MKKSLIRVAAVGAVAALFATMAPMAHAATTPTYDTTTDAPIYLMDGTTATEITSGTQLEWNYGNTIVLTGAHVPADLGDMSWSVLPGAAGATDAIGFISAVGSERTPSAWKQWSGFQGNPNPSILLPSVYPGYLGFGAPAATKAAGGTYSMGIALTDSSVLGSTHVVKAYYTTINVDAGTGTWTFAGGPCTTVNTDVPTTTTLAAASPTVEQGSTTVLTATVSASKAVSGNVEFYDGATKKGSTALSGGTASYTATVGSVGANTFSAKYVESVVETAACPAKTTDTFKASTSADVTVPPPPVPPVPPVPTAPSDNALNANTANGAGATYDAATHTATLTLDPDFDGAEVDVFVYSSAAPVTPTYLGVKTFAAGKISVVIPTLKSDTYKLAITQPAGIDKGDVIAWASFTKTDAAISPSFSKQINADVANSTTLADGEFSLTNDSGTTVNLTNPVLVLGESVVSGELGKFHVTDLRQVSKPGWTLTTTVADFTKGNDTIDKSRLGIAPVLITNAGTGATAPSVGNYQESGSAVYPWDFAVRAAGAWSGVSTFNADLVFTAPAGKPAGTYTSTLTLTLISK